MLIHKHKLYNKFHQSSILNTHSACESKYYDSYELEYLSIIYVLRILNIYLKDILYFNYLWIKICNIIIITNNICLRIMRRTLF